MAKPLDQIFIHAGLPKTGSSFLQSALESIEQQAGFAHTSYPVLHPIDDFQIIRTGNGAHIARLLVKALTADFDRNQIKTAFDELFEIRSPHKSNLLISSEVFAHSSPERFKYLKELMLKVCNNIKVIVYVRPFVPWAWSAYNQLVKRSNLSSSFEDWSNQGLAKSCEIIVSNLFAFGVDIKPIPFSKTNLILLLLEQVSEDENIAKLIPDVIVNRSLTEIEGNLLRIANDVFKDEQLSVLVSDLLIKTMPYSEAAPLSADMAKIAEKHLPAVLDTLDKYNNQAAQEIKKLFLCDYELAEQKSDVFYAKEEVHNTVRLLLTAIFDHQSRSTRRLSRLNEVTESFKKSRTHFDPIHYLLLNADVLDARVDPNTHFKKFGKRENRFTGLID